MGIAKHAKVLLVCVSLTLACSAADQSYAPEIVSISPTSGPEGSRVEIAGKNFQDASAVLFGTTGSTFKLISPEKLIALAPRWVTTSAITVVTPSGRATSAFAFAVSNDPRVPDGVGWRAGYVNPVPPPRGFNSVLLWGIAIADTRLPGHQSAEVEIARTQLFCRVDGQEVVLNDDRGSVRGGLYLRQPWFGGNDYSEPMPLAYDPPKPRRGAPSRGAYGPRLALLECVLTSPASGRQTRRLHGQGPRQNFTRSFAAVGHGLLAFPYRTLGRLRRE